MSESPQPGSPPRLLVSVRDAAEAETAIRAGADLIDAKDPDRGALGDLPLAAVRAIRAAVAGRAATSAVAGEPDGDAAMAAHVRAMAESGVDWVKVAVRPAVLNKVAALRRAADAAPGRLIAVLFAEDDPRPDSVAALAAAGFRGAMIDTAGKDGWRLPDLLNSHRLETFTAACRARGLISGLAGSLRTADAAALARHRPDYLGFRGGLCLRGDRRSALDPARVADAVRTLRGLAARDAA
ncbi:(5-formylfuran-3-yl)methyl phosphate synthase [uncultured Methylobacterium sp.]|uniref:(5-formylfuran-3-yl)methyl phosphate synthase n=1 Tax=uncultured Methylobacterium sp. TaxID=157278 RepID=UPI0035CC8636